MDDFYIDKKGLAAYFEIEWLDKLRELGVEDPLESKSKAVPDSFVASNYNNQIDGFINQTFEEHAFAPNSVLEIGPALGRNCYNLVSSFPSINEITVVEPSARFLSNFKDILIGGCGCDFHYIKDVNDLGVIWFDTISIAKECSHIKFSLLDQAFGHSVVKEKHDLTICLNVLDQCESPTSVMEALKLATLKDGILVVSCSYQWNKKHLVNKYEAVDDINAYFDEGWVKLSEDEHEYRLRFNDRYSKLFLTHVVAYKKLS